MRKRRLEVIGGKIDQVALEGKASSMGQRAPIHAGQRSGSHKPGFGEGKTEIFQEESAGCDWERAENRVTLTHEHYHQAWR